MKNNRGIFICFTPFQCITAMIINKSIAYTSDIIIVNGFAGAVDIAERMKKTDHFVEVYLVDNIFKNGDYSKISQVASVLNYKYYCRKISFYGIENHYSDIYVNNYADNLVGMLIYNNKDARVHFFDEGYSSYLPEFFTAFDDFGGFHKILEFVSKVIQPGKRSIDILSDFYLYEPLLDKRTYNCKRKKIDCSVIDEKFKNDVSQVFGVGEIGTEFDGKYVFFEECFSNIYGDNSDLEIVEKISDIIDKSRMIIKLHPRDKRDRFTPLGYVVNKSVGIPWEAVALSNVSPKVMITYTSGAVLNYRFLQDRGISTILLYKLDKTNFNRMTPEKEEWIDNYKKLFKGSIFCPEDYDELETILKGIEN